MGPSTCKSHVWAVTDVSKVSESNYGGVFSSEITYAESLHEAEINVYMNGLRAYPEPPPLFLHPFAQKPVLRAMIHVLR